MGGLYDEVRLALHAIWTRRWLALAVAWGVCVLGWLVVSQIPNRYDSRAKVFVQMNAVLPDPVGGNPNAGSQATMADVRQTLISASNLEKVVRGTDLARTVATDADVAARAAGLMSGIKLVSTQDNLFEITTSSSSPRLAQQITQKLIDLFAEENLADDRQSTTQSLTFLDKQLADRQKQLQDAEAKRADFQNRYLGSLPGTGTVADRIGAARAQMAQVDGDLAAASSALAAVSGQMAGTPRTVAGVGGGGLGPARARVATIQGQLADARARGYTEQHPDVVALRAQLAAATASARGEPLSAGADGASNPLFLSLQSMAAERQAAVAALRIRKNQIQSDLDQLNAKLSEDPEVAAEQGQIDRSYQVLRSQYEQLLTQREQVALRGQAASDTDAVKFNIIEPPTLPTAPAAPNRLLLLTGVLVAGLAAGIGAAFVLGQLRQTFATAPRLERASGLPVIGSVGEVVTRAQSTLRTRHLRLFLGGTAALGGAWALLVGLEILQRGMAA